MMLLIDKLNHERHKLSSLGSLLLVFLVFSMAQALKGPAEMLAQEAMELTTTLIEPLLQPAPQTPTPQLVKPEPKNKMLALPNVPMTPSPVEPARDIASAEPQRTLPTVTPSAPTVAPAQDTPKLAPQQPNSVSLENNYIASVRATLNANKRYPTGREASLQRPSGKVKLWFVLSRNGALQEAGIEESSNAIILDNAALSTLRRTTYAPWPEGSWGSQSQHKFTVTLDFVPLN